MASAARRTWGHTGPRTLQTDVNDEHTAVGHRGRCRMYSPHGASKLRIRLPRASQLRVCSIHFATGDAPTIADVGAPGTGKATL